MITEFDKKNLGQLRSELQAVLDKYATSQGITLQLGNIRFTPESFSAKIEAKVQGGKSIKEQRIDAALQFQAQLDKLTLEPTNGKQLVGYNSRAYKMPYIYKDLKTGKRFKTTRTSAKIYFGKAA